MRALGRTSAWLAGISAWFLLLASLLGGVFFLTHAYGFYEVEYAKYDAAADIGVSYEDLMSITEGVLDYLNGKRDNLDMQAQINGEWTEVFTQREKDHMVDVLALVRLGRWGLVVSLLLGGALLALAIVLAARSRRGRRMCVGYLIGAGSFLLVFGAIALCFVADFTKAFYIFHTIFFSNDLWMLPSDAVMIKMVPQAFFSDCALLLAGFFGGFLLLSCAAAFVCALCFKTPPPQEDQPMLRPRRGRDGESYYQIRERSQERPAADEIFQRLGLKEEELEELQVEADEKPFAPTRPEPLSAATASEQEPPTQKPAADMPAKTNLRLEMKLDLRILETENGLELVPDPEKPLDIRVHAAKGELSMLVQAMEKQGDRISLQAPGLTDAAALRHLRVQPPADKPQAESPSAPAVPAAPAAPAAPDAPPAPSAPLAEEHSPSVEELLARMNEMMRGYPQDEDRGEGDGR